MSLAETMRERRKAQRASLDALVASVETRDNKVFTEDEDTQFSTLLAEIRSSDARVTELEEIEASEARAAATRVETGEAQVEQRSTPATVTDPAIYLPDGANGNSYFRDLGRAATEGGEARDAIERLVRNKRAVADEQRAMGNTNTTGGAGGEFAPPTWLVSEWINLLRPGRVTADLFTKAPIPPGTSSVSIPKLLTGTAVALQSTQNSTLATADITTSFVSTGFATIGGKAVWSQQLMDQSAVPFDQIISADLAAAYNAYFGAQIFLGAGTGANNNAVLNGLSNATVLSGNQSTITATTAAAFYSKANGMLSAFATTRYAQPEQWIMHPRRWFWLLAQTDSTGRPLVVPSDVAYNPIATNNGNNMGLVGGFLGLPVYIDPNIPTNLGTGTNQDIVYLLKASDLWLFESTPQAESFRSPYAEQIGILFRLYNYAGTLLNRQSASIATLTGVGLVPPVF